MSVTLKDIAERSGVSIGTVNRALKNNGRISKETQSRILKIAQELNYIPNRAAQALVNKQPLNNIGFVFNGMHNRLYSKLMIGIEKAKQEYATSELSLHLRPIEDFSVSAQLDTINELISIGIDALIIVPIHHSDIITRLKQLTNNHFPVVIIDEPSSSLSPLSFIYGNFTQTFHKIKRLVEIIGQSSSHITIIDQSYLRSTNFSVFERFYDTLKNSGIEKNYTLLSVKDSITSKTFDLPKALKKNPPTDIIICGGSSQIINNILSYKKEVNPNLKVIALDYEYAPNTPDSNDIVSFSLNQNTEQFSYRAIQILFNYLSKSITPTAEIIQIDSIITINEFE